MGKFGEGVEKYFFACGGNFGKIGGFVLIFTKLPDERGEIF